MVIVVAAAGNTGQPDPTYPAGDPNVLTVSKEKKDGGESPGDVI